MKHKRFLLVTILLLIGLPIALEWQPIWLAIAYGPEVTDGTVDYREKRFSWMRGDQLWMIDQVCPACRDSDVRKHPNCGQCLTWEARNPPSPDGTGVVSFGDDFRRIPVKPGMAHPRTC